MLDRLEPDALLVEHREWILKVARITCLKNSVWDEDAEDFAGVAFVKLIENDYAVLRRFRGECDIKTYLATLVVRGFQEYARSRWGRWRPSARALQLGPTAQHLEALVYRDGYTLDEAIEVLTTSGRVTESRHELVVLFGQLPYRNPHRGESGPRPPEELPDPARTDEPVEDDETRERCREVVEVLIRSLSRLSPEDQVLVRGRFAEGRSVADIARALDVPQMPLYRRSDRLLEQLRGWLEEAGVRKEDVADCLALDDS